MVGLLFGNAAPWGSDACGSRCVLALFSEMEGSSQPTPSFGSASVQRDGRYSFHQRTSRLRSRRSLGGKGSGGTSAGEGRPASTVRCGCPRHSGSPGPRSSDRGSFPPTSLTNRTARAPHRTPAPFRYEPESGASSAVRTARATVRSLYSLTEGSHSPPQVIRVTLSTPFEASTSSLGGWVASSWRTHSTR